MKFPHTEIMSSENSSVFATRWTDHTERIKRYVVCLHKYCHKKVLEILGKKRGVHVKAANALNKSPVTSWCSRGE